MTERRKGPLLCVAYKDGKNTPVILSTMAHAGFVAVVRGRNRPNRNIPHIVRVYNANMGGVDLSDCLLYKYLDERKTSKWTKKTVFSLFGRALLNTYIIYDAHVRGPNKLKTRKSFYISALESLVARYQPTKVARHRRTLQQIAADNRNPPPLRLQAAAPRAPLQPIPAHTRHKLPAGKKRNCALNHGRRTRSGWECLQCNVGLCPQCFVAYHQK